MPAQRPDVQGAVGIPAVVAEAGDLVDVDQQLGGGEAQLQQRHQALPAGQHLRLAAGLRTGARSPRRASAAPRSGTGVDTSSVLPLRVVCGVSASGPGATGGSSESATWLVGVAAAGGATRPVPGGARAGIGPATGRIDCGSGMATGSDSASGSGRGCWCGGHGPWTGWPATLRKSTNCGHAQIVGLGPVLGAFSNSSYMRGLPGLCPLDSTAIAAALVPEGTTRRRRPVCGHGGLQMDESQRRIKLALTLVQRPVWRIWHAGSGTVRVRARHQRRGRHRPAGRLGRPPGWWRAATACCR